MFVCKDENKRKRDQERNLFTTTQPCYSYSIYSTKGADFEERIVGPGTDLFFTFVISIQLTVSEVCC